MVRTTMDEVSALFLDKIKKGESWENEYGMCNTHKRFPTHKCLYEKEEDYKVQFKTVTGVDYFKIVPHFYAFPGGSYYWDSVDGEITDGHITFYENPQRKTL
jgi:hypothetical protein